MKKFVLAICGVMIATNAMGAAREHVKLNVVPDNLKWSWGLGSWNENNKKDLAGEFMPLNMIGGTHQNGACNTDEGSGLAIIATDIFTNGNGAEFCTRQIQSANGGGKSSIDIYVTKDYHCEVFCKPGFYGNKCERTQIQTDDCNDNRDYTSVFDDIKNRQDVLWESLNNKNCDDTSKIKTDITPAFESVIEQGNGKTSYAVVLGVKEVKEHAIVVVPVQIDAKMKNRNNSWIEAVYTKSGETFVLCAPGYELNDDKTDCVVHSWCTGVNKLCPGENENLFREDMHEWGTKSVEGQTCRYITCKSGTGFKDDNSGSKTCIPCEQTRKQGVKDDICKKCDDGQFFKNKREGCVDERPISATQLIKGIKQVADANCWRETNPKKYSDCVKCGISPNNNAKCWNNHSCGDCS